MKVQSRDYDAELAKLLIIYHQNSTLIDPVPTSAMNNDNIKYNLIWVVENLLQGDKADASS